MRAECPHCHKAYDIPDERLPIGQDIAFPCPGCKKTIELHLKSKSAQDDTGSSAPSDKELPRGEALKKRILRSVSDLPPMPQTVFKVREIMGNPNSSFKELADILETDQAIATRVLKIANSAYYGMSGKVSSIQHASVVLGHKTIGELMTMASTSSLIGDKLEGYGLDAGDLWRHSLGVAFGSKIIADRKNPDLANDAFSTGLIHDSGKLILDKYILERKEMFQEFMSDGQQTFLTAEKHILGFDHPEIASEVCKSWNVPEAMSVAIRYHHYPSESQENVLAYIVHMADAIAMMTGFGLGVDGMLYQMDDKARGFLDFQEDDVSKIMSEVLDVVESVAKQMNND
jgi:HD-like signal output (HDOD) protein